ncbi:transferase [Streptomyces sp. NPDC000851]
MSVERDPERAGIAAEVFADRPEVEVVTGDRRRIEDYGPYDLLAFDGGGTAKAADDTPADPARLLTPGGTIVIDDFTPAADWPPLHEGAVDLPRRYWLEHPALKTVEQRELGSGTPSGGGLSRRHHVRVSEPPTGSVCQRSA